MTYIYHYASPIGKITMASAGKSLTGLWFDGQKYFMEAAADLPCEEKRLPVFDETALWLDIYFSGKIPDFTPEISIKTTAFRKAVWEILLGIPYGKTVTYGRIADIIVKQNGVKKMSPRAVGGAVSHNPVSIIIPCHRVVGAGGKLTGYAGGADKKIWLLEHEGIYG